MGRADKSPLRYPGGKTRAIKILYEQLNKRYPNRSVVYSPFFGGGSFEIFLSHNGYRVFGNDLFIPLYLFWKWKKNDCDALLKQIKEYIPFDKEKFDEFRKNILVETDELKVAAYFFLLNRTSFGGTALSSGYSPNASRLKESSFTNLESTDIKNITLSMEDCNDFLLKSPENEHTIVYADPPYYIKKYIYGKDGNMHKNFDHAAFAATLKKRKDWILSYNDCEFIRELYADCEIINVSWKYGMDTTKKSSEILIFPKI